MISSTTHPPNKGGGGGDDVAMSEGGTSSDSSFSKLIKRKLEGPETIFETPSKKIKLNASQDVVNSIYRLSNAPHRRSVCIISANSSVSKLVLRTPNVPFLRQVHT
ncbi:unnamed protein product [Lathyrus oleraceus]|uniref:Uncharacterized protein n=1 Tax=Pisum sativum TaxID=3888 RepID=A0A9D5AF13_PEA|nr:hypothetical protein KIW84_052277 [Pisum sativum]